uniref:Uncharacterized protein n=1 Tax=Salix viminalis TaxID=40686 RepID=A0A6N2LDY5_SALVM
MLPEIKTQGISDFIAEKGCDPSKVITILVLSPFQVFRVAISAVTPLHSSASFGGVSSIGLEKVKVNFT